MEKIVDLSKEQLDILADLVVAEIGNLNEIKRSLEQRGIKLHTGINVRLIDLKHILVLLSYEDNS